MNRQRTFVNEETGEVLDIFNYCEDYLRIVKTEQLPYFFKTCAEELVRDVWAYNIKYDFWTWLKPDFNGDIYLYVKQPVARYGHAGTYVELQDKDTFMLDGKTYMIRKYLYIYGGMGYDCETACLDLWRYEIPYGPIALYPKKQSRWHNRANHWTMILEDP